MTIYVDDSMIPFRGDRYSHMQADSLDELHAFAVRLGLKREWFQPSSRPELAHYDVSSHKREQAIAMGAVSETWREGAKRTLRDINAQVPDPERGAP